MNKYSVDQGKPRSTLYLFAETEALLFFRSFHAFWSHRSDGFCHRFGSAVVFSAGRDAHHKVLPLGNPGKEKIALGLVTGGVNRDTSGPYSAGQSPG